MADVFISYHEDTEGELAESIAEALENTGISCWCSRRDMTPGGDFVHEVMTQIDTCKVFLLLLNKEAAESIHVGNEVGNAFKRYKVDKSIHIMPYKTDDRDITNSDLVRYYFVHSQIKELPKIEDIIPQVVEMLGMEPIIVVNNTAKDGTLLDIISEAVFSEDTLSFLMGKPMYNIYKKVRLKVRLTTWEDRSAALVAGLTTLVFAVIFGAFCIQPIGDYFSYNMHMSEDDIFGVSFLIYLFACILVFFLVFFALKWLYKKRR